MKLTPRRLGWALPWVLVAACGSSNSNGTSTLSKISTNTGDAQCPAGGSVITTGLDANGNGVLDDAEVTGTAEVCTGSSSAGMTGTTGTTGTAASATLVSTLSLPGGDPHCGQGGTEIQIGLDNGAGGGTANDGVLQAGEITSTQYVCNSVLPVYVASTTPPATPAGQWKIITSGGNGTTSTGGNAGGINPHIAYGTLGGAVKVWNTGTVSATFTLPTVTFVPGATPMSVTVDTSLNAYASTVLGLASPDTHFLVNGDQNLYANVANVATPVTSVNVAAGVTLTLPIHYSGGARFKVANDVQNAGKITTARLVDAHSAADLTIYASSYYGAAGSSIDLRGLDNAGGAGGNGGSLAIYNTAHTINQGPVDTSGGNGDTGGAAGGLQLDPDSSDPLDFWNTAALTARGGTGAVNGGGSGGGINITSGYQSFWSSGATDSSGGAGVTAGGNAASQYISCYYIGTTVNTGAVTAKGGACTATDCDGGNGGGITIEGWNGAVTVTGTADTSGGDGKGTGAGGNGGGYKLGDYDSDSTWTGNSYLPTGSLTFAANITTRGGSGGTGGNGGKVEFDLESQYAPAGAELIAYGYTDLIANGGSGGTSGGSGGAVDLENSYATPNDQSPYGPGGAVINYASVSARGGDGVTGGGSGGSLQMSTQTSYNFGASFEYAASFAATVDARGGAVSGSGVGGQGGSVKLVGIAGAENHAAITAAGGAATAAGGLGGNGSSVSLRSDYGQTKSTGTVDSSGGVGSNGGDGGNAGTIELWGTQVMCSAALSATGGNGTANGGNGGDITLLSTPNGPSADSGALSVAAGTATANGAKGTITIDGENVTP